MLRPLHFLTLATLISGSAVTARNGVAVAGTRALPGDGPARLPRVAPESAGMSVSRLAMIDDVVLRGIGAGGFPGAAVIVARHGGIVWERGYGTLDWQSGVAVDPERTMYDLASLTKIAATTAAAMVLVDRGKLQLDERVTHYLAAFSGGMKDQSRFAICSRTDQAYRPGATCRAGSASSLRETPCSRRASLERPARNTSIRTSGWT